MEKKYKIVLLALAFMLGLNLCKAQQWVDAADNIDTRYVNYVENKGQWYNKVLYQGDFYGGRVFLEKNALTYVFFPSDAFERFHPHANANPADFKHSVMTFQAVRMEFMGSASDSINGHDQKEFYNNYYLGSDKSKWASKAALFSDVDYKNLYKGIGVNVFSTLANVRYDFTVAPNADISQIKLKFEGQNSLSLQDGRIVIHTEIGDIAEAAPFAYQMIGMRLEKVDCRFTLKKNVVGFEIKGNYNPSYQLIIDPTLVFATFTGSTADNWGMSATYDNAGDGYTSGICFNVGYPATLGAFQGTFQGGGTGGGNVWPAPDNTGFDIVITKFNPTGTSQIFSTYLGGSDNEEPSSLIVDNAGNLFVLGKSYSTNFPTTAGAYSTSLSGGADLIISKFDVGGAMMASTYIGGSTDDGVNESSLENVLTGLKYNYADDDRGDIIVDGANNVYVASCTTSTNFPTTPGAYQTTARGGQDGCVFEMNTNLSALVWSSYLGGSADDAAYNIALNSKGEIYVVGGTESANFPTTAGVLKPGYGGNIDGFITHMNSTGSTVLNSSFLGTAAYDQAFFVQTDKYDNVYVYGQSAGGYPVVAAGYSNPGSGQFVHEMNATLSTTTFSTVFGTGKGTPDIAPSAFLVDNCQNIYMSGWGGPLYGYNNTYSTTNGLPTTSGAYQTTTDGSDFYFMVLQRNASALLYATYFGGPISLEHVDGGTSRFDKNGIIYQAICEGCGGNSDMPTSPGAWSSTNKGPNCNNAIVKFKIDLLHTVASFVINPAVSAGCAPFSVIFNNTTTYGQTYKWYFGDGDSSYATAPGHIFSLPGTYTVMLVATDSSTCNVTDTAYAVVRVVPPLTMSVTSAFICLGDSVKLNAVSKGATSFSWTPATGLSNTIIANPMASPAVNTSYIVTAKDSFCSVTDTLPVTVYVSKTTIVPHNGQICLGDSIQLGTDSVYVNYAWSTGQTSSTIEANHAGPFTVITTDKHGCKSKDSVEIIAFSKVPLTERDTVICQTHPVQLYADSGNYTYAWGPAMGLNKTNIYDPVANPLITTTYTVTVTNGPCVSVDSVKITVKPIPSVKVTPDSVMILPGQSVTLTATGTPPFMWSPPQGLSCIECSSTIASPDSNTVYYVQVADSDGCSAMDSAIVDIEPTLYIPNAFTPNGNGTNDIFQPKFKGYISMEVWIFDRWGALIYHWNTLDGGWDGTCKGRRVQEDTYVYLLQAESYAHNKVKQIGSVTVIR